MQRRGALISQFSFKYSYEYNPYPMIFIQQSFHLVCSTTICNESRVRVLANVCSEDGAATLSAVRIEAALLESFADEGLPGKTYKTHLKKVYTALKEDRVCKKRGWNCLSVLPSGSIQYLLLWSLFSLWRAMLPTTIPQALHYLCPQIT